MTGAEASLPEPGVLDALQGDVVELALGGVVDPRQEVRDWLQGAGVARELPNGHLEASDDWLACSLPALSADDLLIRTLLRDPRYRLHVDLLLVEVVVAVGAAGRWSRLEDLLFGDLATLAPRFAGVVEFVRAHAARGKQDSLRSMDVLPRETAAALDERCWGIRGSSEVMFPVLRTRYPAFASVPVFLRAADPITAALVAAAAVGEGIRVPIARQAELERLLRRGIPLAMRTLGEGILEVALSVPCRAHGEPEDLTRQPFSRGVPISVREGSALVPDRETSVRAPVWEIVEGGAAGLAFVGAESPRGWPGDDVALGRGLPAAEGLRLLVQTRRVDRGALDPADEALRSLAGHPLFGFWIQILLVEALDRELGEETLLLAPPTHAIVADLEGSTLVYYRPRATQSNRVSRPLRELGLLDDIMARVAPAVGIRLVGVLGNAAGPLSMSLALLARVGIAQTRHDRWSLSAHALDRLHGGGLMTGVIRRGRSFRERLHEAFEELWLERVDATPEACSA